MASSERNKQPKTINENVIQGVFEAEHRPSHDQKWADLQASDAPLARAAVVRSAEIREEGIDPGEAYLMGIADSDAYKQRQELVRNTSETLAGLPEVPTSEVDPPA
jgi:hypothetical protein